MSISTDVAMALNNAAIGATLGTSLFIGPKRAASANVPQKAVFVVVTGGAPAFPILGTSTQYKSTNAQIMVRSDLDKSSNAFRDGEVLANAAFNALQFQPAAGYIEWVFVSSAPLYLGQDEAGAHLWSMNLTVTEYA